MLSLEAKHGIVAALVTFLLVALAHCWYNFQRRNSTRLSTTYPHIYNLSKWYYDVKDSMQSNHAYRALHNLAFINASIPFS